MGTSMNSLLLTWIPLNEMSTAAAVYTSGNQMAGFIGAPAATAFCASKWKWPAAFYLGGLLKRENANKTKRDKEPTFRCPWLHLARRLLDSDPVISRARQVDVGEGAAVSAEELGKEED